MKRPTGTAPLWAQMSSPSSPFLETDTLPRGRLLRRSETETPEAMAWYAAHGMLPPHADESRMLQRTWKNEEPAEPWEIPDLLDTGAPERLADSVEVRRTEDGMVVISKRPWTRRRPSRTQEEARAYWHPHWRPPARPPERKPDNIRLEPVAEWCAPKWERDYHTTARMFKWTWRERDWWWDDEDVRHFTPTRTVSEDFWLPGIYEHRRRLAEQSMGMVRGARSYGPRWGAPRLDDEHGNSFMEARLPELAYSEPPAGGTAQWGSPDLRQPLAGALTGDETEVLNWALPQLPERQRIAMEDTWYPNGARRLNRQQHRKALHAAERNVIKLAARHWLPERDYRTATKGRGGFNYNAAAVALRSSGVALPLLPRHRT